MKDPQKRTTPQSCGCNGSSSLNTVILGVSMFFIGFAACYTWTGVRVARDPSERVELEVVVASPKNGIGGYYYKTVAVSSDGTYYYKNMNIPLAQGTKCKVFTDTWTRVE